MDQKTLKEKLIFLLNRDVKREAVLDGRLPDFLRVDSMVMCKNEKGEITDVLEIKELTENTLTYLIYWPEDKTGEFKKTTETDTELITTFLQQGNWESYASVH